MSFPQKPGISQKNSEKRRTLSSTKTQSAAVSPRAMKIYSWQQFHQQVAIYIYVYIYVYINSHLLVKLLPAVYLHSSRTHRCGLRLRGWQGAPLFGVFLGNSRFLWERHEKSTINGGVNGKIIRTSWGKRGKTRISRSKTRFLPGFNENLVEL